MVLNKYAVAILQILLVATTAFVAIPDDQLTVGTLVQLAILVVGAVAAYFLPLLKGSWKAGLKTISGIVIAVLTALIPFLAQGGVLTRTQIVVVIIAALTALANEVGVAIRQTSTELIDAGTLTEGSVVNVTNILPASASAQEVLDTPLGSGVG